MAGLLLALVAACSSKQPQSENLGIEAAMFAEQDEQGRWVTLEHSLFDRGDDINLVLLFVTGFEAGEDGLHHFDMNIEVMGPDSQIIFGQANLFGENGHRLLPSGILSYPCGTYSTTPEFRPGNYWIKLTIFDKISGKKASRSKQFMLQ